MSWRLNVDFLGLTAPVPLDDRRWLVVLPDLKKGSDPALGLPHHIDAHQALVGVPREAVHADSTVRPRLRYEADGVAVELYRLDGHFLSFRGAGDSVSVAEEDDASLSLVPPIAEIEPRAAELDRSLLSDWYGERIAPADGLAATVLLDRGRLRALPIFREANGEPTSFQFLRGEETVLVLDAEAKYEVRHEMPAMADGFRLEVDVDSDVAGIVFGDRDGNETELLVHPAGADELTIRVHNQELENVMGLDIDPADPKLGDVDFAIFYALSTGWAALRGQPLPIPYRVSTGGGGKNRPCMSPVYAGIG